MNHCCDMMKSTLEQTCDIHGRDCVDIVMAVLTEGPNRGRHGIPIHDGGSSVIVINFCPWCGVRLAVPELSCKGVPT